MHHAGRHRKFKRWRRLTDPKFGTPRHIIAMCVERPEKRHPWLDSLRQADRQREENVVVGSGSCSPAFSTKMTFRLDHQVPIGRGDDSVSKFDENDDGVHRAG
jgi:hypothetical protein